MFTCQPVHSEELHGYGSVLQIVPAEELRDTALGLAGTIADKRTNVIRGLKAAMAGSIGRDIRSAYRQELSYTYELNISGEARSARSDFLEGRRAGYTKTGASLTAGGDDGQA
jgi:enoyl-CoA hydratase